MKWPWNRDLRNGPSREIEEAQQRVDRDLTEARHLRERAREVGESLTESRLVNHYAMALAQVLSSSNKRAFPEGMDQ